MRTYILTSCMTFFSGNMQNVLKFSFYRAVQSGKTESHSNDTGNTHKRQVTCCELTYWVFERLLGLTFQICDPNAITTHTRHQPWPVSIGGHLPKSPQSNNCPYLPCWSCLSACPWPHVSVSTLKAVSVTSSLLYRLCWLRPAFKAGTGAICHQPARPPARLPRRLFSQQRAAWLHPAL